MSHARAALALRGRVLWRRHGTPLDALVVAGTVALAAAAGQALGRDLPAVRQHLAALASLGLLAAAATGAALAHHGLYRARELTLLLAQPVAARDLVLVRLLELGAGSAVAAAVLAALVAGATPSASPGGAALACLLAAPLLGGAQLLGAAAWRRVVRHVPARALAGALVLCGTAAVVAVVAVPGLGSGALERARPVLEAGPGGAFASLAREPAPAPAALLLAGAVLAAGAALALVPGSHGEDHDAASARPSGERRLLFPLLRLLTWPLPRPGAALVRRDLALVLRGSFPRGALVLGLLPLGLLAYREAARDASLEDWEGELAALLTQGFLSTIATFLFAVDFPRERLRKLVLERAQPVRGEHVLLARAFEAALPGVALALALGALALAGTPRVAGRAGEIALSASLLALAVAHQGAAFGLRAEASGADADLAVAAAYPASAAALVIPLAIALTIHPLLALGYPLLYAKAARDAALLWEGAEVPSGALSA